MAALAALAFAIRPFAAFLLTLSALPAGAIAGESFDTAAIEASVVRVVAATPDPDRFNIGTGWIVHGKRLVVTNNHVIEGGTRYVVALMVDGKPQSFQANLLRRSEDKDLALLEAVSDLPGKALPLADYDVKALSRVIAIGFPGTADIAFYTDRNTGEFKAQRFGPDDVDFYKPTWTEGVASRYLTYFRTLDGPALQHPAAINKGNSGGPLIDACGRVLGVNTIRAIDEDPQGVFYAVHPKEITRFLETASYAPALISKPCTVTAASQAEYIFPMFGATLLIAASALWLAWQRQIPAVVKPLTAVANRVSRIAPGAGFGEAGRKVRAEARRVALAPPPARRERAVTLVPKSAGPEVVIDRDKLDRGQALVIGRSRNSDVILTDDSVSRRHARMWIDKSGMLWMEDLGSKSGTYVGSERITKAPVPAGTHVRFGAVGYTFHLGRWA